MTEGPERNGDPVREDRVLIRRLGPGDDAAVIAASTLFDHPARPEATARFLSERGHHLFLATVDDVPAGFVTGVETTHPDKGTEMFLYELAVDEGARNRGVGRSLVAALADVARERGCYGMWVLTDDANPAALRAYTAAGGTREQPDNVLLSWTFSD
jgi:ribosomal protein S18 acetylase RimI-like enzyme